MQDLLQQVHGQASDVALCYQAADKILAQRLQYKCCANRFYSYVFVGLYDYASLQVAIHLRGLSLQLVQKLKNEKEKIRLPRFVGVMRKAFSETDEAEQIFDSLVEGEVDEAALFQILDGEMFI